MNTPAHLIFGTAFFAKPGQRGTFTAALIGAFAPDFSLYAMVFVSIFILGIVPRDVFENYYYSDQWQAIFAVDNSFVLWGLLLGFALWRGWPRVLAFAGAGLLHLALDFPLHTHDARMHFWPLSDWVFHSPFSYWDSQAHANIIGPIELGFSIGLAAVVWRRFPGWQVRATIGVLIAFEVATSQIWSLVF
jgi:hypothetical protein